MTADPNIDPVIKQLRREISDTDRAILELVNKRLRLVARIKDYKATRGLAFVDPDREQWMLTYLARTNRGPLSIPGVEELLGELLELTKREVARREAESRQAASA